MKTVKKYVNGQLTAQGHPGRAGSQPESRVFPSVPRAKDVKKTLEAARKMWIGEAKDDPEEQRPRENDPDFLRYVDSDGRYLDFHALRVTFGTSPARNGARLQESQRLMRHSDPKLTANV